MILTDNKSCERNETFNIRPGIVDATVRNFATVENSKRDCATATPSKIDRASKRMAALLFIRREARKRREEQAMLIVFRTFRDKGLLKRNDYLPDLPDLPDLPCNFLHSLILVKIHLLLVIRDKSRLFDYFSVDGISVKKIVPTLFWFALGEIDRGARNRTRPENLHANHIGCLRVSRIALIINGCQSTADDFQMQMYFARVSLAFDRSFLTDGRGTVLNSITPAAKSNQLEWIR